MIRLHEWDSLCNDLVYRSIAIPSQPAALACWNASLRVVSTESPLPRSHGPTFFVFMMILIKRPFRAFQNKQKALNALFRLIVPFDSD